MKAYSTGLRQRVIAACDARDGTRQQIAARFTVSESWIRKLLRQRRDTGCVAAGRIRGGADLLCGLATALGHPPLSGF